MRPRSAWEPEVQEVSVTYEIGNLHFLSSGLSCYFLAQKELLLQIMAVEIQWQYATGKNVKTFNNNK